jgi:hypothetical protein
MRGTVSPKAAGAGWAVVARWHGVNRLLGVVVEGSRRHFQHPFIHAILTFDHASTAPAAK